MNLSRPKVKAQFRGESYAATDLDFDPTLRYVDLHSRTPWTTSEKSSKAATAPLFWPQELRAALKKPEPPSEIRDEEDLFKPERTALEDMRKSAFKINKFYIPISKLPPLGGPDPRAGLGKLPPSCAVDWSVPRAHKIMQRWQSMPRLRSQLPAESLQIITDAQAAGRRQGYGSRSSLHERLTSGTGRTSGRTSGRREVSQPVSRREDTDARLSHAFREMERGSARGKKEHPHIPCSCCEHKVDKPWMQAASAEAGSARASAQDADRTRTPACSHLDHTSCPHHHSHVEDFPPEHSAMSQSQQSQRERHTVSWEEPAPSTEVSRQSSSAVSECWEEKL